MVLALVLIVVLGFSVYIYKYISHGAEWISYSANKSYYSGSVLTVGTILDRNGTMLASTEDGERIYSDDKKLRIATLHAVGDKYGYIGTGALKAFASKLIGFNLFNGAYSLNGEGNNLYLTIDSGLNETAYDALDGRNGTVAVYNYKTGDILCMVSSPSYDPLNPPDTEEGGSQYEGIYINRFLSSTYTPGSTFKLITTAAAIENIPDIEERTFVCSGSLSVGSDSVTCTKVHGSLNFYDALAVSCNCTYAQLTLELGADTLSEYAEKLGLTESFEIDGIKTAAGSFEIAEKNIDLAWSGVGQYNTRVNPAAMLRLMGAIANKGSAVTPQLIDKLTLSSGIPAGIYSTTSSERLMSASTSLELTAMMRNNVETIYGSDNFPGLDICAKSGTAEVGSGKEPHAWFVGFLEDSENPLAFVVVVENGGRGSTVAGSVANKVLQAALAN